MSTQKVIAKQPVQTITRQYGGAVGAYRCMTINTSGQLIVCSVAGELVYGVNGASAVTATSTDQLYYANNQYAVPNPGSVVLCVSGTALTVKTNTLVATDGNGAVIQATSSHAFYLGILLTPAAVSGDIVSVWYCPGRATAFA